MFSFSLAPRKRWEGKTRGRRKEGGVMIMMVLPLHCGRVDVGDW